MHAGTVMQHRLLEEWYRDRTTTALDLQLKHAPNLGFGVVQQKMTFNESKTVKLKYIYLHRVGATVEGLGLCEELRAVVQPSVPSILNHI